MQHTLESIARPPSPALVDCLHDLPTPSLVYDIDGVRATVDAIREDLALIPGAQLNFALKACHTPAVLAALRSEGLGADTASMAEVRLAVATGFNVITATGPSFVAEDLPKLAAAGITLDYSSVDQVHEAVATGLKDANIGLRIRVPLPERLCGRATFGTNSRFGVSATDPVLHDVLAINRLKVTRLHTHTGQMTPSHFLFKLRYLLKIAEFFVDVCEIDMGGGFFSLYSSRLAARTAFKEAASLLKDLQSRTGRRIALQLEPGGALLAPHGFLVTTVRASEWHGGFAAALVTTDSSAWNFAPWHKPQVVPLTDAVVGESLTPTLVAGNTLYENDFFGVDRQGSTPRFSLPPLSANDRLLLTGSGAYTMTNLRRFHQLEAPREYMFVDGALQVLA